jgi:hypothetical protein
VKLIGRLPEGEKLAALVLYFIFKAIGKYGALIRPQMMNKLPTLAPLPCELFSFWLLSLKEIRMLLKINPKIFAVL